MLNATVHAMACSQLVLEAPAQPHGCPAIVAAKASIEYDVSATRQIRTWQACEPRAPVPFSSLSSSRLGTILARVDHLLSGMGAIHPCPASKP